MQELPKAKGDPAYVKNSRGALISDVVAELHHRVIRFRRAPHLQSYVISSMYGGCKDRGIDTASLHLKALMSIARKSNMSIAVFCRCFICI